MIPSVLISAVLALDVLLLGAAQGRGPTRSLGAIKTASCEFTLHAVATWKDGEPQAGLTPAKLSFKFEDINTDEGTARVVGPFGPSDTSCALARHAALHAIVPRWAAVCHNPDPQNRARRPRDGCAYAP